MPRDEAKAQFREIVRFDERGMISCTLEAARRLLAAHSKFWVVWLYYAEALQGLARYPEALAALRRTQRICPPDKLRFVYARYGHLYEQRGSYRLAERWFRRAVKEVPTDATYRIFLGAVLARAGRLAEAAAENRRATRCRTGCLEEAFCNLGLVLCAQERYAEARRCFESALELDPKYKIARGALADVERVLELRAR